MTDLRKNIAPIPLRLMMAAGFLYHGWPKLTAAGHQSFVGMLEGLGVPSPGLAAWVVAVVEVAGGLMLLLGYKVRLAVLPLMVDMLVAMFLVHWPSGFNTINIVGMGPEGPIFGMPGIELNLLYLSILTALWFTGAGVASLDGPDREWEDVPSEPGLRSRERPVAVGGE